MMKRRVFLKHSLLAAGAAALVRPARALAATGDFPPGVIYTAERPGKWAGKEGSHAPKVSVEGRKVTITTAHPMTAEHHIVRHTLVSSAGEVIGGRTFVAADSEAVSTWEIPGAGTYRATSFCNLHDFWLTEFTA